MALYRNSPACQDRWLDLGPSSEAQITGDRRLLARVLGNLIKNALEASPPCATVDVAMTAEEGQVEFTVHNESVMPLEVQLQLFQRSFSTKGGNRGLGTYSVKLLTERYLGGACGSCPIPTTGRFSTSGYLCRSWRQRRLTD